MVAGEQRQRAVLGGPRGGGQPRGVLLLHQQHRAPHDRALGEDAFEDGGGDVVGDVPDQRQLRDAVSRGECCEVELEEVALDQLDPREAAQLLAQQRGEPAVQLDRDQMAHPSGDPQGDRTGPRADLDRDVLGIEPAVLDDALGQFVADEEVLAPPLARRETVDGEQVLDARRTGGLGVGAVAKVGGGARGARRAGHARSVCAERRHPEGGSAGAARRQAVRRRTSPVSASWAMSRA